MELCNSYPWTLIAAFVIFVVTSVKGEIRCYCNQASCVSTGYMCKSAADMCFSEPGSGIHGCMLQPLAPLQESRLCQGLVCCNEDMCNYDDPTANALGDNKDDSQRVSMSDSAVRREVWFRAAVIAVPVAGFCVLALLVAAAARILRQDAILRQRRLAELRQIYGHSLRDSLLPWSRDKNTSIV